MKAPSACLLLGALHAAMAQDIERFASANGSNSVDTQWYLQFVSPGRPDKTELQWGLQTVNIPRNATSPLYGPRDLLSSGSIDNPIYFNPRRPIEWTNTNVQTKDSGITSEFYRGEVWNGAVQYGLNNSNSSHSWLPASYDGFFVGSRANFTTSYLREENPTSSYTFKPGSLINSTWQALPFALAIGKDIDGNASGSVVFGGSYDWARVNDTQWHKLPLTSTDVFLRAGISGLPLDAARVGNPPSNVTQKVVFDYESAYDIVLPKTPSSGGADCNSTISMTIAGARFDIETRERENCIYDTGATADTIKLGSIFWSYMYMYADADESVYIARALNTNAPVSIRKFDANEAIEQHPEAKYVAPPPSKSTAHASSISGWTLIMTLVGLSTYILL